MRRRGLVHVKQFTWERCARETLEVMREAGVRDQGERV